ncbi:tetratricopeptide repeat protein [Micromonospora sp. U21]|uniref:tetratricopeptide repeat protein n=1 Tax=Micromonospora sp. U21 TaxID=2824899 RepID=UPI001B387C7E|nr:tetratricopeptide repeat protein [Micromonospora sp. U21]MBQ0902081.1 tetratricopeptide repeat protein [Micromonospora sp. U21]
MREFYAVLAASRQSAPPYWPASILGATREGPAVGSGGPGPVGQRRKRVYPMVVTRPGGSLPDWFWWGIVCGSRNGVPSVALTEDLRQLAEHQQWLEARWHSLATFRERHGGKAARAGRTVGEETAATARDQAVEAIVGHAVPGLGLAWLLGKWVTGQVLTARDQHRSVAQEATIDTTDGGDVVDDTASTLVRLARPGFPTVIAVEDLHLADPILIELLGRLLRSDAPILLLTSTWPGMLDADGPPRELVDVVAAGRLLRIRHDLTNPPGMPPGAGLGVLDDADLATIVRFYHPATTDETIQRLVTRYPNPLPLELVCTLPRVQRRATRGAVALTEVEVAELPATVEDLYRAIWRELPEPVQQVLVLGAWSTPGSTGSPWAAGEDRWEAALLADVAGKLFPDIADRAALDSTPTRYGWVRRVDDVFRRFHEPVQRDIALSDPTDLFGRDERHEFYRGLAERLSSGTDDDDPSRDRAEHQARMVLALHAGGILPTRPTVLEACRVIASNLLRHPRELQRVLELTDLALGIAEDDTPGFGAETGGTAIRDALWSIREVRAVALGQLGRTEQAIELWQQLVVEQHAAVPPEHHRILTGCAILARELRTAGRLDQALEMARTAVAWAEQALGAAAARTLRLRGTLAVNLAAVGQVDEALTVNAEVLHQLGDEHPDALTIRSNLASMLQDAGRVEEAITEQRAVLARCVEIYGTDHPETLTSRSNLAYALSAGWHLDEAAALNEAVLADRLRVLGADHPSTLTSRSNLASVLRRAGRINEAVAQQRAAYEDRRRILGGDHPDTLISQANLASALADAGRPDEAIPALVEVVAAFARAHGPDRPETLMARNLLAATLMDAGRADEAIAEFEPVVERRLRLYGADHPETMGARGNLAVALQFAGRLDESLALNAAVLADRRRVLGDDHLDTLTSYNTYAQALHKVGRLDESVELQRIALDIRQRRLGADHPHTLSSANNLAVALVAIGRASEAVELHERTTEGYLRTYGPDHPNTFTARDNHASALRQAGRREAVGFLINLLTDRVRVFGPSDPLTIRCADLLGNVLSSAGLRAEAIEIFTKLAEIRAEALGAEHPDTVRTRAQLNDLRGQAE